jgi:hypothetical protein
LVLQTDASVAFTHQPRCFLTLHTRHAQADVPMSTLRRPSPFSEFVRVADAFRSSMSLI